MRIAGTHCEATAQVHWTIVCVRFFCALPWTKVKATSRQRGVWATLSSTTPVFHTPSCARNSPSRPVSEKIKKRNRKINPKKEKLYSKIYVLRATCVLCRVLCDLFKNQNNQQLRRLAINSINKLAYVNSEQTDRQTACPTIPESRQIQFVGQFCFFRVKIFMSVAQILISIPSASLR